MDVVKVKNLSYTFPGQNTPLLREINFSLAEGEFVLLCGESGSGKSTLLNCLNGIIPHLWQGKLEGEVWLKNKQVAQSSLTQLVGLAGTVFQDVEGQIFQLKVQDELVFGLENLGLSKPEITERLQGVLPLVNLPESSYIQTLSGGQKQRLIIGAVLAMLPQLIILDEPLANLDLPSAHNLLQFLKALCQQGKTIIMVEHRLDLAASYVDRLLYLEEGTIKEDLRQKKQIIQKEKEKKESILIKTGKNYSSSSSIVEIENLSFSYGKKQILENLKLELKQGEKLVILGENGCGKSTFLKILAGINKGSGLKAQKLESLGQPLSRVNNSFFSRNIGFVLQNPNHQLFMNSVFREISLNASNTQAVEETLQLFGLEEVAERHPLTLSQGQKRLLAIAAITVSNPALLLLDEPTIGQDYGSLGKILDALTCLNEKKGMSMITVTHDQKAAEGLADKVAVFSQGTPGEIGGRELIEKYFSCYVDKDLNEEAI